MKWWIMFKIAIEADNAEEADLALQLIVALSNIVNSDKFDSLSGTTKAHIFDSIAKIESNPEEYLKHFADKILTDAEYGEKHWINAS